MTGLLEGRSAIVTGAGRGIGRAIAEGLAAEGASVIVADIGASIVGDGADPGPAREVAAAIGKKAIAFPESVASPGAARHLVEIAVKNFGGIDIVVNNAAILRDAFVFRADPGDWDAVIRNNLSAPFYLINAATAVMRDQGKSGRGGGTYDWGRIVNIVSSAGLYGNLGQSAYASAKAGLFGLTRVAAMDLQRAAITVNAVAPFARHPRHRRHPAGQRRPEDLQGARAQDRRAPRRQPGDGALHAGGQGHYRPVAGRARPRGLPVRTAATGRQARSREPEALAADLVAKLGAKFTDMTTDLEAFNTEPLV